MIPESTWQTVTPTSIVVTPLWWRSYQPPELQVQALHDGRHLSLRLTWKDNTHNAAALRPQDFEDMAAVQLSKSTPEPFLGMGSTDQAVDVWLWNPSGQAPPGSFADMDAVYPHMAVDIYPFEKASGGPRAHALELQPAEFLTARAAGNLRSDPNRGFSGNSIQSKGFGTVTMRPRVSQAVQAIGNWKDNRWTVVLRRPLEVGPGAGIALAPGDHLSIAFAIWDGAARDRNGQKLISIWHDLHLE
jgi:hypothetical protein